VNWPVQCLMLIVSGVGITCCVIFHVALKEPSSHDDTVAQRQSCSTIMSWRHWLREPHFYLVRHLIIRSR